MSSDPLDNVDTGLWSLDWGFGHLTSDWDEAQEEYYDSGCRLGDEWGEFDTALKEARQALVEAYSLFSKLKEFQRVKDNGGAV